MTTRSVDTRWALDPIATPSLEDDSSSDSRGRPTDLVVRDLKPSVEVAGANEEAVEARDGVEGDEAGTEVG